MDAFGLHRDHGVHCAAQRKALEKVGKDMFERIETLYIAGEQAHHEQAIFILIFQMTSENECKGRVEYRILLQS